MSRVNICIDCGKEYEYDSGNALGASSIRCCNCRKKDSALNKKLILFSIAGNEVASCRKCGYRRSIHALTLIDTKEVLSKPKTQEEKEKFARSQYILCLNCQAEIQSGEVEAKVVNRNTYPIKVEFYFKNVIVEKTKIEIEDHIISEDALPVELVRDEEIPQEIRTVQRKTKRLEGESS